MIGSTDRGGAWAEDEDGGTRAARSRGAVTEGRDSSRGERRRVARLTPLSGLAVDDVLNMPLGLDVWERDDEALVVAADEGQLSELERRHIARVEYLSAFGDPSAEGETTGATEVDRERDREGDVG